MGRAGTAVGGEAVPGPEARTPETVLGTARRANRTPAGWEVARGTTGSRALVAQKRFVSQILSPRHLSPGPPLSVAAHHGRPGSGRVSHPDMLPLGNQIPTGPLELSWNDAPLCSQPVDTLLIWSVSIGSPTPWWEIPRLCPPHLPAPGGDW